MKGTINCEQITKKETHWQTNSSLIWSHSIWNWQHTAKWTKRLTFHEHRFAFSYIFTSAVVWAESVTLIWSSLSVKAVNYRVARGRGEKTNTKRPRSLAASQTSSPLISTATSPSVHVSVCRRAINSHWCRWWAASSNGFLLVYIAESVPVWITRHPHRVINSYAAFDSNCAAQPPTGRLCLPVCFSTQHQVLLAQWRDRRTGRPRFGSFVVQSNSVPNFCSRPALANATSWFPVVFFSSSSSGDFRRN